MNYLNVSAKPALTVFNTISMLVVGTGSVYALETIPNWQHHLMQRSSLGFEKTISSHIDVRSPKQHLENIRAILNPAISDLANLFNVSRQAIYKWLSEESQPERDKYELILTLSGIADIFKDAGIERADILLYMKNSAGMTLFDLLKNRQPLEAQIETLITEARAMESSYHRSGIAQSKTKPTNDWISSISIPAYPEDL